MDLTNVLSSWLRSSTDSVLERPTIYRLAVAAVAKLPLVATPTFVSCCDMILDFGCWIFHRMRSDYIDSQPLLSSHWGQPLINSANKFWSHLAKLDSTFCLKSSANMPVHANGTATFKCSAVLSIRFNIHRLRPFCHGALMRFYAALAFLVLFLCFFARFFPAGFFSSFFYISFFFGWFSFGGEECSICDTSPRSACGLQVLVPFPSSCYPVVSCGIFPAGRSPLFHSIWSCNRSCFNIWTSGDLGRTAVAQHVN